MTSSIFWYGLRFGSRVPCPVSRRGRVCGGELMDQMSRSTRVCSFSLGTETVRSLGFSPICGSSIDAFPYDRSLSPNEKRWPQEQRAVTRNRIKCLDWWDTPHRLYTLIFLDPPGSRRCSFLSNRRSLIVVHSHSHTSTTNHDKEYQQISSFPPFRAEPRFLPD
jgi:hypothetical protein